MALDRSALLAQAVAPMLARVRAHRDQLDYPGRALLEYLENHIFDTDLGVGSWRRACKAKGVTAVHQAQAVIGTTLGVYLEELRVETAMRLMVISGGELPCGDVGLLVGYEGEEAFRQVFERRTGLTPSAYRQQVMSLRELGRRPPDPIWVRSGWLEQLGEAGFDPLVALQTVAEIEAACGITPDAASGQPAFEARVDYERWLMERWWPRLRGLPGPELLSRLARGFEYETPALCELLLRQVAGEAQKCARRGVEIAELALVEALKLGRHLSETEHLHLLARAWAWAGHARRCAQDELGAARAFRLAGECLAKHPAPPAVVAEVRRLEAG